MATSTSTAYPDCSTLANFKAWAQLISNALAAFGWIQTADTGQVNWSTVALPASGVANAVYEVWKSNDALSAAFPIYLKVEYFNNSTAPGIRITVGTNGTNGAGVLNTPHSDARDMSVYSAAAESTILLNCYFSGDSGSFRMVMFNGGAAYPTYYAHIGLIIGRSRDVSGNATGEYVPIWAWYGSSHSPFSQVVQNAAAGGATGADASGWLACVNYPGVATSNGFAGNVLVSPVFPFIGALGNPTPDLCVGSRTDFPTDGGTTTVTFYGVAHTYLILNNFNSPFNPINAQSQANALVRFE